MKLFVVAVLSLTICALARGDTCSYESCNPWSRESDAINVHLICHSHGDLGWIKTVDQYYYGSEKKLVPVGVEYILNTVVDELQKDPSRRFAWAETGFLWRWLNSHHDFERHNLAKLVQRGQMEIVGGGWVQNDEAAAHYVDIIDQMAFGLRRLNETFGRCAVPRVAWQIDPFGHSREMANLFAMMGFDALFFTRLHYLEKANRLKNNSLEFIWNASDDLKTNILTSISYQDNYGPPEGFCFDALCGDDPIMDSPLLDGYNVDEKLNAFVKHVKEQASHLRTNHVMLMMGSDFQYTNANQWYTNLDKLIKYINNIERKTKIRVFYSTPSCYLNAINEAQPRLPHKSDDFFPYASSEHSYWTGLFTSRPTFKGFVRQSSAFLQLAKQLDAFASLGATDEADLNVLREAVALAQHHDAITGTAKENVTRDYEKRLALGWDEGEQVINDALAKLLPKRKRLENTVPTQVLCPLSNETICEFTEKEVRFTLSVFNAKGHPVSTVVRIPFYSRNASVWGPDGKPIEFQLTKSFYAPSQINDAKEAPYEMSLPVSVPALGFTTYFVSANRQSRRAQGAKYKNIRRDPRRLQRGLKGGRSRSGFATDTASISNGVIEVSFDEANLVSSVKTIATGKVTPLKQEFFFYQGLGFPDTLNQSSGAYVFRPNGTEPNAIDANISLQIVQGPFVSEVRQTINSWVTQVIRLFKEKNYIEFEWTVGPIPKESTNPVTKEVITRYTTNVRSSSQFFTDSNGRQLISRRRNSSPSFDYANTEPVAGNYFPVVSRMFIKDSDTQLTVLTDRSQGGTSLRDGQIEIMLHRRAFYDDHWGVDEALDEPGTLGTGLVVRGRHWVLVDTPANSARLHRSLAYELFYAPILSYSTLSMSPLQYADDYLTQYSGLTRALPDHVNLLTLEQWTGRSFLIRLEHVYQNEEDPLLSKPVTVDLNGLFTSFDVISMQELNLAANRKKGTPIDGSDTWNRASRFNSLYSEGLAVQLKPMEIRTFKLEVQTKL